MRHNAYTVGFPSFGTTPGHETTTNAPWVQGKGAGAGSVDVLLYAEAQALHELYQHNGRSIDHPRKYPEQKKDNTKSEYSGSSV